MSSRAIRAGVDERERQQGQREQGRAHTEPPAGDARQMIAPVTAPANSDPNDHAIRINPAYGSTPASFANATTLTSMPPNTMPSAPDAMATGTRTRHGNRVDPRCPCRRPPDRRLAAALSSESDGTNEPDDGADADSERRMESRGEEGDQHRPDDEDDLVQHGLKRERGVQ